MNKVKIKAMEYNSLRECIEFLIAEVSKLKQPSEITIYTKNPFGLTKIQDKKRKLRENIKKSPNKDLLTELRDALRDGGHLVISNKYNQENKSNKKYYYAIKKGINVENKIVTSWDECKKYVNGYDAVYKKFESLEECEEYFNIVNVEKIREQKKYVMDQKKNKKLSTKKIQIDISNEMYNDLEKICRKKGIKMEHAIKFAINNYLY